MSADLNELSRLLEAATPGPWAYRPQEHDDWGMIRTTIATEDGWHPVVARARDVGHQSDEDYSRHRRENTDPTYANAALIVAAVNALPDMLPALQSLHAENERLRGALEPFVDLKAQRGAHGIINKKLDGFAPVTVTVTKTQMLAACKAALSPDNAGGGNV